MSGEDEQLRAEVERLRAENAALKTRPAHTMRLQVSTKGGVSLYGIRRFPITFYADEWEKVFGMSDEITRFIQENADSLKRK